MPALSEEEIPHLQALMQDEEVSTSDICEQLGVSKDTLYSHIGPEGTGGGKRDGRSSWREKIFFFGASSACADATNQVAGETLRSLFAWQGARETEWR